MNSIKSEWMGPSDNSIVSGGGVGELSHLCSALHIRIYLDGERDTKQIHRMSSRIAHIIGKIGSEIEGSILLEEGRALVAEVEGNFEQAIYFRFREIQRVIELHLSEFDSPLPQMTREFAFWRRNLGDLERRLRIIGQLEKLAEK